MTETFALLDSWACEAVARYGDNWQRIAEEFEKRLARLGVEQREQIRKDVALVLSCSESDRPGEAQ